MALAYAALEALIAAEREKVNVTDLLPQPSEGAAQYDAVTEVDVRRLQRALLPRHPA